MISKDLPNGWKTNKFRLFKIDVIKGEAKEIRSLGDKAIFVGCNASISIDTSKVVGAKPNHIYFTYDWTSLFGQGPDWREIGAYNVEDETIQYVNQGFSAVYLVSPAIWVAPSF